MGNKTDNLPGKASDSETLLRAALPRGYLQVNESVRWWE